MFSSRRRGFTMVELLVVMGIIAILMAMLLPAVNTAREAGRRASCANNIRNLGLALNNYHQSHKTFPPSMFVFKDTENKNKPDDPTTSTKHQQNWLVCILPFIEQIPVYKKFDLKKPLSDQANYAARGSTIPLLLCPTDTGAKIPFSRTGDGDNWARGNYGANASLMPLSTNNMGMSSAYWSKGWLRGVMGADVACSIDEIYDGVTNTILLAELRIGLGEKDRRGTWALGGPGSSSIWGHGTSPAIGPNNCSRSSDTIAGCSDVVTAVTSAVITRECMGCGGSKSNTQATTRSRHAGGVNVCMADGSTRFLSDYIDRAPTSVKTTDVRTWAQDFRVWERLNASADRLPIDMTKF